MAFAIAQRLDRTVFTRMFVAGGAWGLMLAAGFFAMNAALMLSKGTTRTPGI